MKEAKTHSKTHEKLLDDVIAWFAYEYIHHYQWHIKLNLDYNNKIDYNRDLSD